MLFEGNQCVTKTDLSPGVYDDFIKGLGTRVKLSDDDVDYLLLAAKTTESVDAMEEFFHGEQGRYNFVKYAVTKNERGKLDVAIAIHHAMWDHGQEKDPDALARELQEQSWKGALVDFDGLSEQEQETWRTKAVDFIRFNEKKQVTPEEKDYWTIYFHDRALSGFNTNCIDTLLDEKNK